MGRTHYLDKLLDEMPKKKRLGDKPKHPRGDKVKQSKLTELEVKAIRLGYKLGFSTHDLSRFYTSSLTMKHQKYTPVTRQQIWRIVARKDWKHVTDVEVTPELKSNFDRRLEGVVGESLSVVPVEENSSKIIET